MPKIFFKTGSLEGKAVNFKDELTMGRLNSCDITIHDEQLSRRHTKIFRKGDQFFVEDMKSRNGTYLNGEKVSQTPLKKGDLIVIFDATTTTKSPPPSSTPAPTSPPTSTPENWEGKEIGGFKIGEYTGSTTLWDGFEAYQSSLDRKVNLKLLKSRYASQPKFAEKLLQSAKSAGQITHGHIVAIFDVGQINNQVYLCQELLNGVTFEDLLHAGQIEMPQILEMLQDLASALEFIHENNSTHGGISTNTIFFTTEGEAKFTNLGLAPTAFRMKLNGDEALFWSKYTSPEYAQKQPLSFASDIYSLGIVAFEMATGQIPFSGNTPNEIRQQHQSSPAPRANIIDSRVPGSVDELIRQMLSKRPEDRPTAMQVRTKLQEIYRSLYGSAPALESLKSPGVEKQEMPSGRRTKALPSSNFTVAEGIVFAVFLVILFFLSSSVTKLLFTMMNP